MKKQDRRCVVLGGGGFLGSVVTRHLVEDGWSVRVFDKEGVDLRRLQSVLPSIEMLSGDFMNVADLARAIDGIPNVMHFIGTTIPQSSMNDVQFDIESNVLPTVRLLELLRLRPDSRLFFASSGGTVYGLCEKRRPLQETDSTEPISPYGVSKLTIEKYIQLYGYIYGLKFAILRIANPYGESQSVTRPQGAVGVFLHKILNGEPISIWGDGSVVRDYVYEGDVAAAVKSILNTQTAAGIYNVGSGCGMSLNQLLAVMKEVTGRECHATYDVSRKFDVPYNVLSIDRIKRDTGWSPSCSIDIGLRKMLGTLSYRSQD